MTISLQICYNELEIIFIILETNYSVRFLFYVTIIIMLNDDLWLNVGSKYNYWKALNIDLLGKKLYGGFLEISALCVVNLILCKPTRCNYIFQCMFAWNLICFYAWCILSGQYRHTYKFEYNYIEQSAYSALCDWFPSEYSVTTIYLCKDRTPELTGVPFLTAGEQQCNKSDRRKLSYINPLCRSYF